MCVGSLSPLPALTVDLARYTLTACLYTYLRVMPRDRIWLPPGSLPGRSLSLCMCAPPSAIACEHGPSATYVHSSAAYKRRSIEVLRLVVHQYCSSLAVLVDDSKKRHEKMIVNVVRTKEQTRQAPFNKPNHKQVKVRKESSKSCNDPSPTPDLFSH
jgi:hypothetical protein